MVLETAVNGRADILATLALNQLINVAVAEKLSALRTDETGRPRDARRSLAHARGAGLIAHDTHPELS